MAHTYYHPDQAAAADSGTIALVVLLLGVLIIGLIAYRTLWASPAATLPAETNVNLQIPSTPKAPDTMTPSPSVAP